MGEDGEMLVKEYKPPLTRRVSSEDLMYGLEIRVNNTVLYT